MNSWAELIGLGSGLGVFSASKGILDTQVESTIEGTTTRMDLRCFDVNSSILGYIRVSEGDGNPRIHAYILSLFPIPFRSSQDAAAARETG